jgi:hypothetical protein
MEILWPVPMDGSGNQNFLPIGFEEQQRLSPVRSFNQLTGKVFRFPHQFCIFS